MDDENDNKNDENSQRKSGGDNEMDINANCNQITSVPS